LRDLLARMLGLLVASCGLTAPTSPQFTCAAAHPRSCTPTLTAAGQGRRSAVLAAAAALGTVATGVRADTLEDIAARSNAQAEQLRIAKAQAKADKEAQDAIVNAGASVVLLGLAGFAAFTAFSYVSANSGQRFFNLDDSGNERGYSADEPLFQARASDAAKAAPKKKSAPKKAPAKAPAFELPKFGEFGSPPKAAPKAAPKKPEPAKPAFKFPWD